MRLSLLILWMAGPMQFKLGITRRGMVFMVLEPVEVFVAFAADLASVWLMFLHA